jgi:hypothetical protein
MQQQEQPCLPNSIPLQFTYLSFKMGKTKRKHHFFIYTMLLWSDLFLQIKIAKIMLFCQDA